jgi:hypothetical protein
VGTRGTRGSALHMAHMKGRCVPRPAATDNVRAEPQTQAGASASLPKGRCGTQPTWLSRAPLLPSRTYTLSSLDPMLNWPPVEITGEDTTAFPVVYIQSTDTAEP